MSTLTIASNVRWSTIAQIGRIGLQLLSVVIFTRLLPPFDYGLMAVAFVVMNFASLFRDLGTAAALIQSKTVSQELFSAVFMLNLVVGVCCGLGVAVASPVIASLFAAPPLIGILMMMALVFPVTAATAAQLAMLERDGRFREIALVEVGATAAALAVAISAAFLGAGVYSFVVQALLMALISTGLFWIISDHRPSFRWNWEELKKISSFSGNLVSFNFILYFARNADSILIGRYLGTLDLGFYSVANRLLVFPFMNFSMVMNRSLLPVYSRLQADPPAIAAIYLRSVALIALIAAPVMFGMWAVRYPLIIVIMGEKWAQVADILAWFAPMGYVQCLTATLGSLLIAIGRTDILRVLGIVGTVITLTSYFVGLQFGLSGLVIAYFLATLLGSSLNFYVIMRQLGSGIIPSIQAAAIPTLSAMVMAALVALMEATLPAAIPVIERLAAEIVAGIVIYGALSVLFMHNQLSVIWKFFVKR
jgi:PST family polysaccharide transporter